MPRSSIRRGCGRRSTTWSTTPLRHARTRGRSNSSARGAARSCSAVEDDGRGHRPRRPAAPLRAVHARRRPAGARPRPDDRAGVAEAHGGGVSAATAAGGGAASRCGCRSRRPRRTPRESSPRDRAAARQWLARDRARARAAGARGSACYARAESRGRGRRAAARRSPRAASCEPATSSRWRSPRPIARPRCSSGLDAVAGPSDTDRRSPRGDYVVRGALPGATPTSTLRRGERAVALELAPASAPAATARRARASTSSSADARTARRRARARIAPPAASAPEAWS